MNIQNIQNAQGLFRAVDERSGSRKERINEPNDTSMPQINVPDAQDKAVDIPKVSGEKNLLQVVYPPFFPIGNTQDILFIEGVKQLAGEDVKSRKSDAVEERKAIQLKEINNKATNTDASAARHDNAQSTDALMKGKTPSVKHEANPGVVLDFKV